MTDANSRQNGSRLDPVIGSVEDARRRLRLAQKDVGDALGVTQGHYSKVVRGLVPLSADLAERMRVWSQDKEHVEGVGAADAVRMRELTASILRQCMELMHLTDRSIGRSTVD